MTDSKVSVPLLALGIVVAVGGILVGAVAYSSNSGRQLSYNERTAIRCLQAVAAAQKTFREADLDDNDAPDFWTADVAGLASFKTDVRGKPAPLISAGLAAADPRPLAPGKKPRAFCGYFFAALRDPDDDQKTHPTRFALAAWPESYGHSGRETFFIDERGIVHSLDLRGQPPTSWPLQAEPITRILDD